MGDKDLIEGILYYQQCLDKYTRRNDESRVLYCLSKLYKMPINIEHLEKTGVGRTVNALRKLNGEIAEAAKALVSKWKEMVAAVSDEGETTILPKTEPIKKQESEKEKHKTHKHSSSHSHRDSDKKKSSFKTAENEDRNFKKLKEKEESKHHRSKSDSFSEDDDSTRKKKDSKNHKVSLSSVNEEETKSSKKSESDHKKKEHSKHKSKRKRESSVEESDSEKYRSKHKSHEQKAEETSKHRKSKHKKNSDDEDNDDVKCKRTKYINSDDSEDEKVDTHKQSSKSKHKEEKKDRSKDNKKDDSKSKKSKSSGSDKKEKASHSSSKHHSSDKTPKKSSHKSDVRIDENGIGSGSGASFAEALGMLIPGSSKVTKKKGAMQTKQSPPSRDSSPENLSNVPNLLAPKKLAPLDLNVDNLLPEITPNYRPIGLPFNNSLSKKNLNDDETLSAIMYSKISRTKVYSGNKATWGKVPSLFDICTRVLQDNIDALEYTGGVPYLILKPVIERANPDQLFTLEHHNPYLIEDTDELWQLHCNKEFRSKKREELETWRDMYMRCLDEREAKLKALTANIKQSQDKSLPVRQTKLAYVDSYVKPPRNIARKQAKHGTGGVEKKPAVTPSSRLTQLATSGAAGQVSVPNPGLRATSSTGAANSAAIAKPKKAPLMQKTLALMKSRIFRR